MSKRADSTNMKTATIQLRVLPDDKEFIQRAASIEGKTLTDFATSSLQRCAQETISRHETMRLSVRDQTEFVKSLIETATERPRLKAAFKRYKRAIEE